MQKWQILHMHGWCQSPSGMAVGRIKVPVQVHMQLNVTAVTAHLHVQPKLACTH